MEIKHSKAFTPSMQNSGEAINKTCMFTGHRSIAPQDSDLLSRLVIEIETLITMHGVCNFVAGGARGFDMLAETAVVRLRFKYPHIKLILALPCLNQTAGWNETERTKFDTLLEQADEVRYVNREYFPACMHRRNDYMVAMSSYCISYMRRSTGGTAYTVTAARKNGLKIIEL